jgi:hypothetical protein
VTAAIAVPAYLYWKTAGRIERNVYDKGFWGAASDPFGTGQASYEEGGWNGLKRVLWTGGSDYKSDEKSPKPQLADAAKPPGKGSGDGCATNAPDFEFGTFINDAGVKVTIHPGDHAPPHAHVVTPGMKEAQIGQNGKPLKTSRPLTAAEEVVVERNLAKIRSQVDKFMRWYKVCG